MEQMESADQNKDKMELVESKIGIRWNQEGKMRNI